MFKVVIWLAASLLVLSWPWSTDEFAAERTGIPAFVLAFGWIVLFLPLYVKMVRSRRFHDLVGKGLPDDKQHRWQSDLVAMFLQIGGYGLIVWLLAGSPSHGGR